MLRPSIFLIVYLCSTAACSAITFTGPTPYRGQADSPFPIHGNDPPFHFEDFEDGKLNTPGISQPTDTIFGARFHGVVLGPGEMTDSVDGDDGAVDGASTTGHSFRSGMHVYTSTNPQISQFSVRFDFNINELGQLPNAIGFALTDVVHGTAFGGQAHFNFRVTDSLGQLHISPSYPIVDDHDRNGGVSDDYFYGVTGVEVGITRLTLLAGNFGNYPSYDFFEIDHLQYGRLVPEPHSLGMGAAALLCMAFGQLTRRRN